MKKMRSFIVAASLLLITVGIFAGRPRFANDLYVSSNGVNFTQILSSGTFVGLQTTANGNQVTITGQNSTPTYQLYFSPNVNDKVYSDGSF